MHWTFLGVFALIAFAKGQEICLSGEEDPYFLFGTKTAYVFANRGIPTTRHQDIPGCQPIAIWLVNRHGSHNPEADEMASLQKLMDFKNNILNNYRNGNFRNTNQRICTSDLNLLERWGWNPHQNITFAGDLTSEGYMTTQQLAQAWKQRYPGLLTDNKHNYLFKYVNDHRSETTFQAFTEGLFREQADTYAVSKENDETKLRPYKSCPAWQRDVEENNDTLSQVRIFESKQEYREMISNISLRLGFNYDIQKEMVNDIYQMCRYNKAWNVEKISPWCSVFTREDLKRLEYAEDLETYYKYGYGNPMNQKISCAGVKDMMDFFKIHVDNGIPQQPKAMVQITEAPALLLLLAALNARRDAVPLTGDNYHTNFVQARKWSTSSMSPFNANFAAILYKCTPNGNFQVKEEYQVLFMENEHPLYLEGCRVGLCDWSYVKTRMGLVADNCNLDFCNSATKVNGVMAITVSLILFLSRFFQF